MRCGEGGGMLVDYRGPLYVLFQLFVLYTLIYP